MFNDFAFCPAGFEKILGYEFASLLEVAKILLYEEF